MLILLWRTIRDQRWTLLAYSLVGLAFLWMFVAVYPGVQSQAPQVSNLIKNLPPKLNKAFGLEPESFTTFEGLVAGKIFSLVWPIMLISLLISLAASFLAGEKEEGSLEFLLSQPLSRDKIFFTKVVAGIFILIVFIFFSVFCVIPLAKIYQVHLKTHHILSFLAVSFLFGLALWGLALFFSSVFSEKSKVAFWLSGILLFMYVVNLLALIKEDLDQLKYLTLFYYFNYTDLLVQGKINYSSIWVFGSLFFLGSLLALLIFKKKDAF